jgi:integrase
LTKAVDWGVLDRNPLIGLRNKTVQSRKVVRYLSPDEEMRLRTALQRRDAYMIAARASGNRWRALRDEPLYPEMPEGGYGDHVTPVVLLAMNTGLRRGELLSLHWADIDLDARMLTVRAENAKSGRERHVPLNTEATVVLTQWAAQANRAGRVFSVSDVKTAWAGLLESAQITGCRFHDLRHHFASKLVRAGVDLNTVRELLGHADIKMTLRYAHLAPDHLAAAVAKLA